MEWEYHEERIPQMTYADRMNELGKQGWELVSVVRDDDGTHMFFKRPKK